VTRAVFDCVILPQAAARRTGPAAECLQAVRDGRLKLFLSPDILAEVQDVLSRPRTFRKFPALTPEAVDVFLEDLANNAAPCVSCSSWAWLWWAPRAESKRRPPG